MLKFHQQPGRSSSFFTRPLILLVYIPVFFLLLTSANALEGGRLDLGLLFNGAWNYEVLALLTYGVAFLWDHVGKKYSDKLEEDTFEFVLKYMVSGAIGIILGIEVIKYFGSELVFKTLLLELPQNIPAKIPPILIPSGFILLVIAGFRSSLKQHAKRDEMEQKYHQTRLLALKVQLNPHFLFNALNLISSQIEEDPALATDILDELAELLRGILNLSSLDKVPLWKEYEIISHYLKIQEQRFSGRISFSMQLSQSCREYNIPPLLIQPLVENAFVHGFEKSGQVGLVQVLAREEEGFLLLEIKDNGQGFEPATARESIGVTYVREVLELFYGTQGQLLIQSAPDQGTCCLLKIPKENP